MSEEPIFPPWFLWQYRILMGVFVGAVSLILLICLYYWFKRRKQLQQAEELRKKTQMDSKEKGSDKEETR